MLTHGGLRVSRETPSTAGLHTGPAKRKLFKIDQVPKLNY
jgi:hypothetical protein